MLQLKKLLWAKTLFNTYNLGIRNFKLNVKIVGQNKVVHFFYNILQPHPALPAPYHSRDHFLTPLMTVSARQ